MTVNLLKQQISQAISIQDVVAFERCLDIYPIVDIAEALVSFSPEEIAPFFKVADYKQKAELFREFGEVTQYELFELLGPKFIASFFSEVESEVRADFYQSLESEEQEKFLPFLTKKVRADVLKLSEYEPDTAGGNMSTEFLYAIGGDNVEKTARNLKQDYRFRKNITNVYLVDEDMKLKGVISLVDLATANDNMLIDKLADPGPVFSRIDEDQSSVVQKMEKYYLSTIPVLNNQDQLVGVIYHEDMVAIIRKEDTEDLELLMGITQTDEGLDYLDMPSWLHFKKRATWVVSLAAVGIISGYIVHQFESTLDKLIILALYMPMVADTGGNTGSQAATVVIRSLALGEFTHRAWLKVIFKEFKVSLMLAACLGLLAFGKILILSGNTDIPPLLKLWKVALVISAALSMQVITATVIGAALPLTVKKFGGDPAVAASPAITTLVDITGLLIYFFMAVTFLDIDKV
jgi:magnesium transporter